MTFLLQAQASVLHAGGRVLQLPLVRAEDAGRYSCKASNEVGEDWLHYDLLVLSEWPWPGDTGSLGTSKEPSWGVQPHLTLSLPGGLHIGQNWVTFQVCELPGCVTASKPQPSPCRRVLSDRQPWGRGGGETGCGAPVNAWHPVLLLTSCPQSSPACDPG